MPLPASHDWLGNRYEWKPRKWMNGRMALDVERLDTRIPDILVPSGFSTRQFLAAWTQAEALSKIYDVPILNWIRNWPLVAVPFETVASVTIGDGRICLMYTGIWPENCAVYTCALEKAKSDLDGNV